MTTVLVSGVTGLIGRELLPKLRIAKYRVIGCAKSDAGFLKQYKSDNFIFEKVDLIDFPRVKSLFRKYEFDHVIHLAGMIKRDDIGPPQMEEVFRSNCIATFNICSSLQNSHVKKFVFTSSMAVYGHPKYLPIDETHPLNPFDFYGESKVISEKIVSAFCKSLKIDCCILRFPSVLSKQDKSGAIYNFVKAARADIDLHLTNAYARPWDFIDIFEATHAILKAISRKQARGVINVGYGQKIRLENLAKKIIAFTSSKSEVVSSSKVSNPFFCFDIKMAKTALNLKLPSFDQRLKEYIKNES